MTSTKKEETGMSGKDLFRMAAATLTLAAAGLIGAPTTSYADTQGNERRDDRRDTRDDSRDAKDACKEGDDSRAECRQDKRDTKQDARGEHGDSDDAAAPSQ
jgi:Na+/glutamate symporter